MCWRKLYDESVGRIGWRVLDFMGVSEEYNESFGGMSCNCQQNKMRVTQEYKREYSSDALIRHWNSLT